jgi:hypothetical protein
MFDFNREVYICKCSTSVSDENPDDAQLAKMKFVQGKDFDLARLSPQYHTVETLAEMRRRLDRGEYWMVGEVDGEIVTYTWLIRGPQFTYEYLPHCTFALRGDTAYGYGAWTPDHLRGHGYRRRAFLEELRILKSWGKAWEASVFIKQQMEGAKRSLGLVGIEIVPLWKVTYTRQRTLVAEPLAGNDDATMPLFDATGKTAPAG